MKTYFYYFRVATVLTVYGIETFTLFFSTAYYNIGLQQYLPFTVLKHKSASTELLKAKVATVLTVYGIETHVELWREFAVTVATVLTVYGIET